MSMWLWRFKRQKEAARQLVKRFSEAVLQTTLHSLGIWKERTGRYGRPFSLLAVKRSSYFLPVSDALASDTAFRRLDLNGGVINVKAFSDHS